jgi:putative membrane protein
MLFCIEARQALGWWTCDVGTLAIILVPTAIYSRGLFVLWLRQRGRSIASPHVGHGIKRWEAACFFGGQLSLFFALVSPLDRLSDILFSAHMTQHEIIMLISPPLILLGRPWVALLWALPVRARESLATKLRAPRARAAWRRVSNPLLTMVVHAIVVWLWHAPSLYEAALRSELIHAVQHASFFATAALFWWAILRGQYGRLGYGLGVAFVFATAMQTSVLGALITIADRLWYPLYGVRASAWQIDPRADQVLAGLVMWIPGGVLLTVVALGLFAAWLGEAQRRVATAERRRELEQGQQPSGGHGR